LLDAQLFLGNQYRFSFVLPYIEFELNEDQAPASMCREPFVTRGAMFSSTDLLLMASAALGIIIGLMSVLT